MWRRGRRPKAPTLAVVDVTVLPGGAYAYLLGMYLGDGDLTCSRKGVYRLRIHLDSRYPLVIEECAAAMTLVMPRNRVGRVRDANQNLVRVATHSKCWAQLLPQHGAGLKHRRDIELAPWQRKITRRHPRAFVRGLMHSDGSRHLNTVRAARTGKRYSYVRYEFSNRSEDIKRLLCEHLDLLDVDWRPMGRWAISVAKRASVAELDRFVGPKR